MLLQKAGNNHGKNWKNFERGGGIKKRTVGERESKKQKTSKNL